MTDLDRLQAAYAEREERLTGSDRYSYFNLANLFILQQRQRAVISQLVAHGLTDLSHCRLLELGCGRGGVLAEFLNYGVDLNALFGVDLIPARLDQARTFLPLPLTCADGQHLPYGSNSFDLVLQFTVFSSILDNEIRKNLAQEMVRVLRPTGFIFWYDFWLNPINPQTRGVRPAEIRQLFPNSHIDFHRITLAPPLARWLVPVSWLLAGLLEKLIVFNTHYLAVIRPNPK